MSAYESALAWLDQQQDAMTAILLDWANINSGTFHQAGLKAQGQKLHQVFAPLADTIRFARAGEWTSIGAHGEIQSQVLARHLLARRRSRAPRQVLLAIHMDTVYGADSPFQSCERLDERTLRGPGVADAKGGLVIMLFALRAFERYVQESGHDSLGWKVILNSDEEIGSPGSAGIFHEAAKNAQLGLLFEPSLPGGDLVSSRKGSGNFSVVARGRSAHSGRDFSNGRNAIVAAAEVASHLHQLTGHWPGMTLNAARIDGGGPSNIVPALAILRFNIRYLQQEHEPQILAAIHEVLRDVESQMGVALELHGEFRSPPKPCDALTQQLLTQFHACGKSLGLDLHWSPSGGACDGNRLAAWGLPNVDTLGVRGGQIHSPEEFVLLESLPERAKLTALFLMQLADGTFSPPPRLAAEV
jgi:glutamate carboxypeptidase